MVVAPPVPPCRRLLRVNSPVMIIDTLTLLGELRRLSPEDTACVTLAKEGPLALVVTFTTQGSGKFYNFKLDPPDLREHPADLAIMLHAMLVEQRRAEGAAVLEAT